MKLTKSSKHCFEVVDRTDAKHVFEVVDETDEVLKTLF
ncbi:chlorohydrolase [Streptococcus pneumoniae]|nr:chlorohydrolase [Streptococcus pneumoniae]